MEKQNTNIFFHTEDISFEFTKTKETTAWIKRSILLENKKLGAINCVFCSDEFLLDLNQKYLNHDTYTDVITFNYVEGNIISGDVFISIDRVKENSTLVSTTFNRELSRVIIHGVLHLIGYNDKTIEEAQEIRAKEDFYLTLLP